MKLSDQRISHLSHLILDDLRRADLLDCRDQADALRALKETMDRVLAIEDEADTLVRLRLDRQKTVPGSREWQVMYDRYLREELSRLGL